MSRRRILNLWFPRLGAERLLRRDRDAGAGLLAVVEDRGTAQWLTAVTVQAEAAGLHVGQSLREAMALVPTLQTRRRNPAAEQGFLAGLRRWAGRFSPLVATEGDTGLWLDITGCAHLFGGEAGLCDRIAGDCAQMGLTVRAGLADTPGAAWALAHHGAAGIRPNAGNAITVDARATRSRAVRRPARPATTPPPRAIIAPEGQTHGALSALSMAALRLEPATLDALARLGLRRIGDLYGQPRAALARRFGQDLVRRLDQALGSVPEPISPGAPDAVLAVRLTLPDPIGLLPDIVAGLDRLLPRLCDHLRARGIGARILRFEPWRADGTCDPVTVTLARASADPDRIRPLLLLRLDDIDAGFGIDMLRLVAARTEPLVLRQSVGHLAAADAVAARLAGNTALDDLIGRLGARIGMDAITRRHPAESHIPEKSALTLAAAWSDPHAGAWPPPPRPRPVLLWSPEPVFGPSGLRPPPLFRWRGRDHAVLHSEGPERIAPEWWLDDPAWRAGQRDYWRVITDRGEALWLFVTRDRAADTRSGDWFCQGSFC